MARATDTREEESLSLAGEGPSDGRGRGQPEALTDGLRASTRKAPHREPTRQTADPPAEPSTGRYRQAARPALAGDGEGRTEAGQSRRPACERQP